LKLLGQRTATLRQFVRHRPEQGMMAGVVGLHRPGAPAASREFRPALSDPVSAGAGGKIAKSRSDQGFLGDV
jgi:hypothetical protein